MLSTYSRVVSPNFGFKEYSCFKKTCKRQKLCSLPLNGSVIKAIRVDD